MILILFILYTISPASVPVCQNMDQIRANYGNIDSESKLLSFIALIEMEPCPASEPYMASAIMQKAQFAFAPWTQYRYFIKGKNKLELYIKHNPSDLEARYIRFLVQTHAPFFLGYRKEIKDDVSLIKSTITNYDIPDFYKKQILEHIEKFNK